MTLIKCEKSGTRESFHFYRLEVVFFLYLLCHESYMLSIVLLSYLIVLETLNIIVIYTICKIYKMVLCTIGKIVLYKICKMVICTICKMSMPLANLVDRMRST